MNIKMSPNITVRTDKYQEAVDFYSMELGFQNRSDDPDLGDFDASPLRLFVIADNELNGLVHELLVEDLDQARNALDKKAAKSSAGMGKARIAPSGILFS
jgi:catechol 2,3-dioxygenase-like lactoylglutathione lyase family enzyme